MDYSSQNDNSLSFSRAGSLDTRNPKCPGRIPSLYSSLRYLLWSLESTLSGALEPPAFAKPEIIRAAQ